MIAPCLLGLNWETSKTPRPRRKPRPHTKPASAFYFSSYIPVFFRITLLLSMRTLHHHPCAKIGNITEKTPGNPLKNKLFSCIRVASLYFHLDNNLKIRHHGNIQTEIPPFHRRRQARHFVFPSDSPQKHENCLHRLSYHTRGMGRADFVHTHYWHTGTAGGTATDYLQGTVGLQTNHLADYGKGAGNGGIYGR